MQRFKTEPGLAGVITAAGGPFVLYDDIQAELSRMYDEGVAVGRVMGPAAPAAPQLSAKTHPIVTGLLDYAPNAIAAIAAHSKYGNDKHNGPGTPLRWSFHRSTHHADAVLTHLLQRGTIDPETGKTHTIAFAWRAIMLLETELLAGGATPGRAVSFEEP
jgi:hypothetical protein